MKRILVPIALVAMLALAAVGCGSRQALSRSRRAGGSRDLRHQGQASQGQAGEELFFFKVELSMRTRHRGIRFRSATRARWSFRVRR